MKFLKLNQRGFHPHLLTPLLAILAVVGIGALTVHLTHATASQYYSGPCTGSPYSSGSSNNGGCVTDIQSLLDGIEHHQVSTGGSYRTATALPAKPDTTVFKYGSVYYLAMNGSYNAATQNAVHRMYGNNSLTSGNDSTTGWQTLCKAAVAAGLNTTTGGGQLKFTGATVAGGGAATSASSPDTMIKVFAASCGKATLSGGTTTTTATATKPCTNYTFSDGSSSLASSATKPAPADCVRFIQTVLNGIYQSNYQGTYDSHADSFSSQTATTKGLLTADGSFGAATRSQVQAFQSAYNSLGVDGVVGSGTWSALCGEAMSFKPDTATWKKQAYLDAINVLSGQKSPWTGCSSSAKQAAYGIHATAPTVGVPAPVATAKPTCNAGQSTSACTCPSSMQVTSGKCEPIGVPGGGLTQGSAPSPSPGISRFAISPETIKSGQSATLSWSTTNTSKCNITGGNTSSSSPVVNVAINGTKSTGTLRASGVSLYVLYSLTCWGVGTNVNTFLTQSIGVTVNP